MLRLHPNCCGDFLVWTAAAARWWCCSSFQGFQVVAITTITLQSTLFTLQAWGRKEKASWRRWRSSRPGTMLHGSGADGPALHQGHFSWRRELRQEGDWISGTQRTITFFFKSGEMGIPLTNGEDFNDVQPLWRGRVCSSLVLKVADRGDDVWVDRWVARQGRRLLFSSSPLF